MWQNYGICGATQERNAPWRSQGGAFLFEKKHYSARYAYRMALSRQNLASSSPSSASSSSKQPSDALACSPPRSLVVHMHCTLYTGVWLNLGRCMCARRQNHTPVVNSSSPFYRRGRVHARETQGSASHDHRTPASVPAAHRRAPTTHAPPRAVPPRRKRPAARAPLTNQPFHRSLPAATTLERLCCAMKRCSGVQYLMIHSTRKHKLRIQKRWSGAQYLGGQPFNNSFSRGWCDVHTRGGGRASAHAAAPPGKGVVTPAPAVDAAAARLCGPPPSPGLRARRSATTYMKRYSLPSRMRHVSGSVSGPRFVAFHCRGKAPRHGTRAAREKTRGSCERSSERASERDRGGRRSDRVSPLPQG